jgi:hypothetical protein
MVRVVTFWTILAAASIARADDPAAWEATLGDLIKAEKAGFGGLCGIAVDPHRDDLDQRQ